MLSNNADLIATALRGPQGPSDSGYYTGTIVAWDSNTGLNTVMVNEVPLSNLKAIQQGVGVPYSVGDVVMIVRKQTQYFILGKVTSVGTGSSSMQSATVATEEGTASTSWGDLATVGPSVTVNIGSSARCLVIMSCQTICAGTAVAPNGYIGGYMSFSVQGSANTGVLAGSIISHRVFSPPGAAQTMGFRTSISGSKLVDSSNGLSPGLNTFSCKYMVGAGSPTVGYADRTITVIPL